MASDKELQDINRNLRDISRSFKDMTRILETLNKNFVKAVTLLTEEEEANADSS